jgi:hypothetical protein
MPAHNFRLAEFETAYPRPRGELGVPIMSKAILSEAREIALLMSMLVGLSALSLDVACAAMMIADTPTQHVASFANTTSLASLEP